MKLRDNKNINLIILTRTLCLSEPDSTNIYTSNLNFLGKSLIATKSNHEK